MNNKLSGKRVLVIGAARQGQASARYLVKNGAIVTINDRRSESELQNAKGSLKGLDIQWVTGSHPINLLDKTDSLCISGGVPLDLPIIIEASKKGIPLINDTQLFMEMVPCKTIGITGSAGKTTTTSLVESISEKHYSGTSDSVWVGGNIGDPLLNHIDQIQENDLAVLEISSFQLEQMTISPAIALILNITPNHLDRHKTMDAYITAKSRILDYQNEDSTTILGRDDPNTWKLRERIKGRLLSFGFSPLEKSGDGIEICSDKFIYHDASGSREVMNLSEVHLRGNHNILNIMAACLVGLVIGACGKTISTAIDGFQGVPHRLEFVRTRNNSDWYNDSKATTPEQTLAAIRSFDEPLVLLLGGRDKNLPWKDLIEVIQERVRLVILFGEASEMIDQTFKKIPNQQRKTLIEKSKSMHEAVLSASNLSKPGEVVLFSPGGTSFDEFLDFEERGERFKQWVLELS